MEIILLRHGETDWNFQGRCQGVSDPDLNETGIRQAEEIAERLQLEKIDAIYSSASKRSLRTAEAICQLHGLGATVDDEFRELDHGEFEGLTFTEIRATYPDFIRKWRDEPVELLLPGGERLIDVDTRVWAGINRIIKCHRPGETVVIVSHNFPILAILCRITKTSFNQYRTFHLDPCGLSRVVYKQGEGWGIVQINNQSYNHPA
ncbi:MAG: histidine phosphatase family protein [Candidatus Binatia bacterium]